MARILVVDDDPLVRRLIRDILATQKHEVSEAENGRRGEQVAAQQRPDVIITDIVMPEQEGIETIIGLRRQCPALKILAISGGGRMRFLEFLDVARKFGADATLAKPFDRAALLSTLAPLLPAPG